jgi:PAS domain S-box-containing protein
MDGKVLIVEDEPIIALDLKQEIEQLGYEVVGVAESAEEALVAAEIHQPDLALLDIRLAGDVDGIQTAKMLRKLFDVAGIFLTLYTDEATLDRAVQELPYGYLTKPFQSGELKATLKTALHKVRLESKERAARNELVTAVDWMQEGVLLTDADGVVRFMNHEAELLTGIGLKDARGRHLNEVLRIGQKDGERLLGIGGSAMVRMEAFGWSMEQADSKTLPVDLNITPVEDSDGKRTGMVVTVRNATERLRCAAIVEAEEGQAGFDRAQTAMVQVDAHGKITRVNKALLEQCGLGADAIEGRALTALKMDPDPRISRDLLSKLLLDSTIVGTTPVRAFN